MLPQTQGSRSSHDPNTNSTHGVSYHIPKDVEINKQANTHTHTHTHTQNPSIHIFSFTYKKNSFLFFIYIGTTFVHNASFFFLIFGVIMIFVMGVSLAIRGVCSYALASHLKEVSLVMRGVCVAKL